MAKKSYSLDQFRVSRDTGLMYNHPKYGWMGADPAQTKWYNQQTGIVTPKKVTSPKTPSLRKQRIDYVKGKYGKYFSAGTKFTSEQGHLDRYKPMSLKGGTNSNYNWGRAYYYDSNGKTQRTSAKSIWGSNINQGKRGATGSTAILNGTKDWVRQLQISLYALKVQAENFRVVVGRRALKVFQNSFKYQQFYSKGSGRWAPLASYTLKKRAKRGTGNKILKEYGDLYKSIKIQETAGAGKTRVYTDIVHANSSHHKKHSICYAGYHNEGEGTYGRTSKPYIQRQFMGYSSYLNPFADSFMRKMMKLYLFDSVFLVKKV